MPPGRTDEEEEASLVGAARRFLCTRCTQAASSRITMAGSAAAGVSLERSCNFVSTMDCLFDLRVLRQSTPVRPVHCFVFSLSFEFESSTFSNKERRKEERVARIERRSKA